MIAIEIVSPSQIARQACANVKPPRSSGTRLKAKPETKPQNTASAIVAHGPNPKLMPIARPMKSPIAQPVRQCSVADVVSLLSEAPAAPCA